MSGNAARRRDVEQQVRRLPALLALAVVGALVPRPAVAVVGGKEAELGEWPWQVALLQDNAVVCGGSLLALDVVVTAAHCTDGVAAEDLRVMAGSIDLTGERRDVVEIEVHEEYDTETTRNDIALLRLETPFDASDRIAPVAVPDAATSAALVRPGAPAVVTGFGATSEDGPTSRALREAELDVLSDDVCERRYAEDGDPVFGDSQVCAGVDRGHVDACYGDSGGPLVVPADDERSSWFLVGLVSWGAGCGRALRPTVYTEVSAYTDWIAEHGGLRAVGGSRFDAPGGAPLRLPAVGATSGKASRYPATIDVTGVQGAVSGVAVELHGLSHERPSDLDVWLQAPDGTVVTLLSDVGGDEPLTDVDLLIAADGADAGGGSFPLRVKPTDREPDLQRKDGQPPASLADLAGVEADGEWRLLIADDEPGATGRLESWTLVLR